MLPCVQHSQLFRFAANMGMIKIMTDLLRRSQFAVLAFCLFLFLAKAGGAQFVEVTAELEMVRWNYGGQHEPPSAVWKTWRTRCVVGTNSWLMETEFAPARHAWLFNGSSVIAYTVLTDYPSDRKELYKKNHPETVLGKGYSNTNATDIGVPFLGPAFPAGRLFDSNMNIPWLAFCSAPYLKAKPEHVPLPTDGLSAYGIRHTDDTTLFEDSLGLPRAVDLIAATNQPVCRYRVLESTNVLGWNFPLRFAVAEYLANRDGRWELKESTSGWIIDIRASEAPQLPTPAQSEVEKQN
jgi:hypothetical protein